MSGTITAIRVQRKNPRRASLYLDGRFLMGLSIEVVQDLGLRRGQLLDDAEMEALRRAEAQRRAYQDALRLLSYRPRSCAEVRIYLAGQEYDQAQVEATVARLQELGLLDDRAFARTWVENRRALRPRGRQALSAELRQKGVAAEVIAEVLDESRSGEDEVGVALELARARARALQGLPRPVFFRRLQGFLARRGFPHEVIREVVDRAWVEAHGDTGDGEDLPDAFA